MSNFRVGQKVVCIGHAEDLEHDIGGMSAPQFNEVYTIRDMETEEYTGEIFIYLEEIVNEPQFFPDGFGEMCWEAGGFRPVVERKTDISIFKAMLTPKRIKERV